MNRNNKLSGIHENQNSKSAVVNRLYWVLIPLILIFFMIVSTSHAQTICIPNAGGVPYNSGPPIWWDADGADFPEYPVEDDRIDDPRWEGSMSLIPLPSTSGATEHVTFRALYSGNELYLSWHVRAAPYMTDDQNFHRLYVGFNPGEDSNPIIFKINPFPAMTSDLNAAALHAIETWESMDGGITWMRWNDPGGGTPPTPSWIDITTGTTRVWFNSIDDEWAIHMKVPTTTGSDLDSGIKRTDPFDGYDFKMWFELGVLFAAPAGGTPPIVTYKWPTSADEVDEAASPPYPLPSTWGVFTVGTSGASCAPGISIARNKIGANLDGSGNPTSRINLNTPNTFYAKPHNNSGATIPASTITAAFRIANWGSTALCDNDPLTDPPDCALLWRDIPAAGNGTVANDAQILDGNNGNIELPWTLSDCERIDFTTDPWPTSCNAAIDPDRYRKDDHQCMLVELSAPAGHIFENNSVYRNMNFVTASEYSQDAEISVLGLGADALNRTNRDVYIYVQTLNMPEEINSPIPYGGKPRGEDASWRSFDAGAVLAGKVTDRVTNRPITSANVVISRDTTYGDITDTRGNFEISVPLPGEYQMFVSSRGYSDLEIDAVNLEANEAITHNVGLQPLRSEDLTFDELALRVPTFVVHVYHDTGERPTIDGIENRVLHAQSSFGYFVEHEGDLEGWRHELQLAAESSGLDFEQLAPNLYRISIPNDGVAVVTTTIEALEPKRLALSFHLGIDRPQGDISDLYDSGFAGTIDIALRLSRSIYLEGLLGWYQFKGKNQVSDLSVTQLSGNLKFVFPGSGRTHLFMTSGGGAYRFESDETKIGFNVGGGIQFDLSRTIALEVAYNYHNVPDTDPNFRFSTLQGILRFRF